MNAQVDAVNLKITELETSFKEGTVGLIDAFNQYKGLESEKWWAEQSEKLENAKNATIDAAGVSGTLKQYGMDRSFLLSTVFQVQRLSSP